MGSFFIVFLETEKKKIILDKNLETLEMLLPVFELEHAGVFNWGTPKK